jgi:CheY-like chemotaxis protein
MPDTEILNSWKSTAPDAGNRGCGFLLAGNGGRDKLEQQVNSLAARRFPARLDVTYRRTASGEEALRSVDTAIPVDYRRILCIVNGDTHPNVVRGRLRQYSDALIADWLAELEEIGFIEATGAGDARAAGFNPLANEGRPGAALLEIPDELRRIEDEARAANAALKDKGAYLAQARLQNREPLAKDPAQTVILLVEDDPDQAALGDLRISMAGYRVRLARNCREMVMELETQPLADLVLLDVMLPDGNGFAILSCMRTDPRLSLLPVIMLTASTGAGEIQRGLDLGADGYITKPYSKNLLAGTIRQVLRQA